MRRTSSRRLLIVFFSVFLLASCSSRDIGTRSVSAQRIRVATYNLLDIRTEDLREAGHERLSAIAATIIDLGPDILLLNEVAYDMPGAPDFPLGSTPGSNGRRFVEGYLQDSPITYKAVSFPSNTGISSGFDLDNDGIAVTDVPPQPTASAGGQARPQTAEGRAYGNDSWGFGTIPGQYAMTLLVGDSFTILHDQIRTFQLFRWSQMPGARRPVDPVTGESWFSDEEWAHVRLSSKNHVDIPLRHSNGTVVHVLASHPTPPAFDGPENRNKNRNHDEIRFWSDYLSHASYIVDDYGVSGGFNGSHFVILGDLNADPDEGSSVGNPIQSFLLDHPLVSGGFVPRSPVDIEGLDDDDTSDFRLRVDYVLPSKTFSIADGGVFRSAAGETEASDHFPVWLELDWK